MSASKWFAIVWRPSFATMSWPWFVLAALKSCQVLYANLAVTRLDGISDRSPTTTAISCGGREHYLQAPWTYNECSTTFTGSWCPLHIWK